MPSSPTADIPAWVQMLRMDLLDEEVSELHEAVEKGDVVKIADAIADIAYVAVGTAVAYGIPFDAVFAEVHRSNMTKVNTPAEAKLVKGPGYEPPDIAGVLIDAADPAEQPTPQGISVVYTELEEVVRERTAAEAKLADVVTRCRQWMDAAIVQGPVSQLCRDILAIIGEEIRP